MKITPGLRLILVVALAALTVGCVILFLGMATRVSASLFAVTVQVVPDMLVAKSGQTATVTTIVTGDSVSGVVVTFSLSFPNLGSVMPPTATTDINGQVTATWTAGTVLGAGILTVTDGTSAGTGTAPITLTAGSLTTITVTPNPVMVTVGTTQPFTATGQDLYHNAVPITPTWTTNVGMTPTNEIDGLTATAVFTAQTHPAPVTGTITATHNGISGTAVVNVVPGAVATITVSPDPVTVTVGTTRPFTATGQDQYHNAVPITPTWNSSVGGAVGETNGLTATVIFTAQSSPAPATGVITATYDNVPGMAAINLVPGVPYTMTLIPGKISTVVSDTYYVTLRAIVRDRFDNFVADYTTVTFDTSLGNLQDQQAPTLFGQAFSGIRSRQAGTAYITATSEAVSRTTTVTFLPDKPYSVTLQANPITPTVGSNSVLTATVYDQYHNVVSDVVTITFSRSLGNLAPTVVTTTNGVATSRISDTLTGPKFITATSQPQALAGTTTITFTPGAPYTVTLSAQSPVTVGTNSVLTVTVTDQYSNTVRDSTPVTLTVSHQAKIVSPVTTTNGIATSWISDTLVGPRFITATSGLAPVPGTATVTFTPGLPYTVTLSAQSPMTVGTNSTLMVTVTDQYRNTVANGTFVTLTVSHQAKIVSPVTTTNGIATSWISDTVVGPRFITATSGLAPVRGTATVTFTPGAPYTIAVQVHPLDLVANSGTTATITATIMDRYENPLVGQMLTGTFPITTMGAITGPGLTNAAGEAYGTWKAGTVPGQAPLSVTNSTITGSQQVTLISGYPTTITVQVSPSTLFANSGMTATVVDHLNNPIQYAPLSGTVSSTLGLVGLFPSTDVNGQTIATWTASAGSSVSSGLLRVSYFGVPHTVSGTTPITLAAGAPATTTVQLGTDTLIVNSNTTTTITATVVDLYNNLVPGVPVTGSLSPTTLGDLDLPPLTDANGQAFGTWTAGTVTGKGVLVVGNASVTVTLAPWQVLLPLVMRDFPPIPVAKLLRINGGAANTYQVTVTLEVSATVRADYIEWMRFSNDNIHWSDWAAFAPTATWKLASNNGLAMVYAQFQGHKGGTSAAISDDILLFKNGDFSQPNLADWTLDPNSKLSVTASTDISVPNNPAGLLGNPSYACNAVPIGYGSLSQTFIMPNVPARKELVLRFNYHIRTSDLNMNLSPGWDRFDVLVTNSPTFSDMNRDKQPYPALDPTKDPQVGPNCTVYDLGRWEKAITVTGSPGDIINVIFRLYNLPDQYYNTYVYLDNVRLGFE